MWKILESEDRPVKRMIWFILAFALAFRLPAAAADETPALKGKQAVLYCAENGQVLLNKDMDTPAHPASITKLMTALLVLESGIDLNRSVTVSHDAVYSIDRDSTHIALDEGEVVTLEPMMYAMLLTSANDAANVLAEAVDGTQEAFAEHMTERAEQFGCRHTHFVNAHGLDDPLHYTTAYDMALITAELLQYDEFLTIAGTRVYYMPATSKQDEVREFWNKQNILNPQSKFYDPTAIAGKNGYTSQAGHTLVTVARRDGVTLIAVTMGSTESTYDKHRDTVAMFEYGFDRFSPCELTGAELEQAAQQAGLTPDPGAMENVMLLVPSGRSADTLAFTADGEELAIDPGAGEPLRLRVPQTAAAAAASAPDEPQAQTPVSRLLVWAGAGLGGLVLLFVLACAYRSAQRAKRRARRMRRR